MENKKDKIDGFSFSPQETQVITELLKDPSYKEISKATALSPATAARYIGVLMKKTGTTSKEELVSFLRKARGNDSVNSIEEILITSEPEKPKKVFSKSTYIIVGSLIIGFITAGIFAFNKYSKSDEARVNNVINFQNNYLNRYGVAEQAQKILNRQEDIKTVVIVGAGGAGKTTLGREVLSCTESKIKFEINAETEDSLYNSYLDLAEYIAISEAEKNKLLAKVENGILEPLIFRS